MGSLTFKTFVGQLPTSFTIQVDDTNDTLELWTPTVYCEKILIL